MLPTLLYAGFMSNVDQIVSWLKWMQYISPMRYAMEITFRAEYRAEDFSPDDHLNTYPVEGYNYDLGMGWCFGIMAFLALGIRIAGFFCLKLQTINT